MNKEPLYMVFYDDYTIEDSSYTYVHDVNYRIIRKDDNFYHIVKIQGKTYPVPRDLEGKIYITEMIRGG